MIPYTTNVTNVTTTSFTANWSAIEGAGSYRFDLSTVNTFTSFVSGYNNKTITGTNRADVTGLSPGTRYYYRVRSVIGSSVSGNSDTGVGRTSLAAPAATAATAVSTTGFTANWQAVTGATAYRLDVSTVSNFATFITGYNGLSVTGSSRAITGLSSGTTYYYRLRAVDGSWESGYSNVITAQTTPATVIPPVAVNATTFGVTNFTANWNAVSGATGYQLDVSDNSSFSPMVSGYSNLAVAGTSRAVSGLTGGKKYYYRVRAVASIGTSAHSNVIETKTVPAPPTALTASEVKNTSFIARWSTTGNAVESYRLDVSTDPNFATYVNGYQNLSVTATSLTVTALTVKGKYYYRVRAVNTSGTSTNSTVILAADLDMTYTGTSYMLAAGITQVSQIAAAAKSTTNVFYDGLGRPVQTVVLQASPSGKDMIMPQAYDAFGRESTTYLPYADETNGWYKFDALGTVSTQATTANYRTGRQYNFYQDTDGVAHDTAPYAETRFEISPLNRPFKVGSAGTTWQPNTTTLRRRHRRHGQV